MPPRPATCDRILVPLAIVSLVTNRIGTAARQRDQVG